MACEPGQHQYCASDDGMWHRNSCRGHEREIVAACVKARMWHAALQDTPAVAGGKDCLRSAPPLVGEPQQAPTAYSGALLSPCCRTDRRLMLFNAVNKNSPCGSQFCALHAIPRPSRSTCARSPSTRRRWGPTPCGRHHGQQPGRALSRPRLLSRGRAAHQARPCHQGEGPRARAPFRRHRPQQTLMIGSSRRPRRPSSGRSPRMTCAGSRARL